MFRSFGICSIKVLGECVISLVCLVTSKIWRNGQTGVTALSNFLGWTSVTAQFYLESEGKYILEVWGPADPKDTKRREAPVQLWLLFLYVFFAPWGLPYVNWASQECCLFHLRFSLCPLTFLCSIFLGFSLPCLLATTILDSFFLF